MAMELIPVGGDATAEVEFVGFESASMIDPAPAEPVSVESAEETPGLPVPAKPRRRRAVKAHRRTHPVRVVFDDDEFLKLNLRAGAQNMALPEFVRRCALRDPRVRSSQTAPPANDLFAQDKVVEVTVMRMIAPLSADLERRIIAYFSAQDRFRDRSRHPGRSGVFTRFGQFVAELVGSRWGHRATPPAGT